MELEELRENQAPQAVFGDPKVSPALAKAMLSAETHKSGTLAGLQTALVAEQASASTASALLVISEFTFFLMMLYLLNHKDVNVKRLSWSTLHSSVAIFISMLLFMSTKSLWILMAGHTLDGTPAGVALSWTRYVVVWILGPVILLRRGVDDESREAWCSIVQWFTAFCGADAFGELMMTSVFSASVGAQFGGFILCCFIIWLQCFGACWARHFVALAASTDREMKEKWADSWQVAETTYAGYILGLTLSMWTRFATSGIPTGAYGQPPGQTGAHSGLLALWTGTAVLVGFVFMFAIMRIIDFIADRTGSPSVRSTAIFCELFIGLTWQRVFYMAIRLSGRQYKQAERVIDVVCMWSLAAICSPAWSFYILPFFLKAKEEEEQEIKSGAKASSEGKESQLADSGTPSKKNDATPAPASEKPKDDDEEF